MSVFYLIGFLIFVGVVLALVPMDATIRRWVVVIVLIVALLVMLGFVMRMIPGGG